MNLYKILTHHIIKNLLSNKLSAIAVFFIILFFLISIFSYQIMPDNSPFANTIELSIAKKEPGFKATFLLIKKDTLMKQLSYLNTFFLGKDTHIIVF